MQTKLVEFKNQNNETLRGILTLPDDKPRAGAVFVQGFERNATVEKKFKMMAAGLASHGVASLRFDASGCGLSDGDFFKTTISTREYELLKAVNVFRKEFSFERINFVAHSLGGCVLAKAIESLKFRIGRIVLIAPALNQKDLLRFYFVRDKNPNTKISWGNYRQYLNEEEFQKDCARDARRLKWNYLGSGYFMEAKDLDFSAGFEMIKDLVLHIHGDADNNKVPLESLNFEFENCIIVKGGDHDLERPDFWEQWFPQAVEFLTNRQYE